MPLGEVAIERSFKGVEGHLAVIFGIDGDEGGPDQGEMCVIPRAGREDPPLVDQATRVFGHQPVSRQPRHSTSAATRRRHEHCSPLRQAQDRFVCAECMPPATIIARDAIDYLERGQLLGMLDTARHVFNHCSGDSFQAKEQRFLFGLLMRQEISSLQCRSPGMDVSSPSTRRT